MVGDLTKGGMTLLTPADVPVRSENTQDSGTEFIALNTEDFAQAKTFADSELNKGSSQGVRWEKVGAEYHVIVRFG